MTWGVCFFGRKWLALVFGVMFLRLWHGGRCHRRRRKDRHRWWQRALLIICLPPPHTHTHTHTHVTVQLSECVCVCVCVCVLDGTILSSRSLFLWDPSDSRVFASRETRGDILHRGGGGHQVVIIYWRPPWLKTHASSTQQHEGSNDWNDTTRFELLTICYSISQWKQKL